MVDWMIDRLRPVQPQRLHRGSSGSTARMYGGHQELISPATMIAIERDGADPISSESEDESTPLFSPSKTMLAGRTPKSKMG